MQHKVNTLRRTQRGRGGGINGKRGKEAQDEGINLQCQQQCEEKRRWHGREAPVDVFLGEGEPGHMGDRLVSGSSSGPPVRGGTCRSARSMLQGQANLVL